MRDTGAGAAIASLLAGAWRQTPPTAPAVDSAQLDTLIPPLQRTGSAALAWWRMRGSVLESHPAAQRARADLLYQSLRSAAYEQRLAYLFRLLEEASIDALLMKGRAAADYYAHPGLRPYGDIDLLVRPADYARAERCLLRADASAIAIDLHDRSDDLPGRSFDALWARSRVLALEGGAVRVLGAEDHLALVCLHFIRHACRRPVWLCDIAAALEAIDGRFDWSVCAGGDPFFASWIAAAASLARELLGADSPALPDPLRRAAPASLVRYTVSEWSRPDLNVPFKRFSQVLREPRLLVHALQRRWPPPVDAAMRYSNHPDAFHLPYQWALMLSRAAEYCGRVVRARA